LIDERRHIKPFLRHRFLGEFSTCGDSRKYDTKAADDLLSFRRGEKFHPFPSFFLVFAADPDWICKTVEHCPAPNRTDRQRCETDVKFAVLLAPVNIPGTEERKCTLLARK